MKKRLTMIKNKCIMYINKDERPQKMWRIASEYL